ncbi:MAG: ferritin family protein [bacterium]
MDELEVLQLAGMMEDSGYRFYLEAAKHVKNDKVRELVTHLAKTELEHKEVFDGLYEELLADKGNYDDSYLFNEEVEKFFRQLVSDAVFPEPDAVPMMVQKLKTTDEVLDLAIKAEKASIRYYEKLAQESRLTKTRKVAERLIKEEKTHIEDLQNMRGA